LHDVPVSVGYAQIKPAAATADGYDVNPGVRPRLIATAAVILAAWSAAQFWLVRRSGIERYQQFQAGHRAMLARLRTNGVDLNKLHLPPFPPSPTASQWVYPAVAGIVGATVLIIIATSLIVGGRRWWALVVVGYPLANLWGWFNDGTPLGLGWLPFTFGVNGQSWLAAGTVVDSLTLVAVIALLVRALPTRGAPTESGLSTVARSWPIVAVTVMWWATHGQASDPANRVWLVQAIVFVAAAALLARAAVPVTVRAVVLVAIMPLCTWTILVDVFGTPTPVWSSWRQYLTHGAVAAVTAGYIAGLPLLVARYPALSRPVRAAPANLHQSTV
jgi:hypothetical protein